MSRRRAQDWPPPSLPRVQGAAPASTPAAPRGSEVAPSIALQPTLPPRRRKIMLISCRDGEEKDGTAARRDGVHPPAGLEGRQARWQVALEKCLGRRAIRADEAGARGLVGEEAPFQDVEP